MHGASQIAENLIEMHLKRVQAFARIDSIR